MAVAGVPVRDLARAIGYSGVIREHRRVWGCECFISRSDHRGMSGAFWDIFMRMSWVGGGSLIVVWAGNMEGNQERKYVSGEIEKENTKKKDGEAKSTEGKKNIKR